MTGIRVIPVEFQSNGEIVRGHLVLPDTAGPFHAICKLHGLPGSPDQVSGIATDFAKAGFLVLTFDFRGFRLSDGIFSISGEIIDVQNAISYLLEHDLVKGDSVALYGASFGGAIAICVAARDDRVSAIGVRAPVVDTAAFAFPEQFDAVLKFIEDIAPDDMHGLRDFKLRKTMFLQIQRDVQTFNPISDILSISSRPLLVVTGDSDTLINVTDVKRLVEQSTCPTTFHIIEGADHTLSNPHVYRKTNSIIIDWFLKNHPLD